MRERGVPGSFWPDPTQRALLQVVLGPPDKSVERWRALQPLDVTTLPPGSLGLLPILYERLAELAPDEPQLSLLHGTYRSTWYRNQLLLDRLARLLPRLRERKVEALVVGGAAAVRRWYPALGSRPVSSLELIVPPNAFSLVNALCLASQWTPADARSSFVRFVDDSGSSLLVHAGAPPSLAGRLDRKDAYVALRARAVELPALEGEPLVLEPADDCLTLCAAGASTAMQGNCQWLIDVHHLLASESPPTHDLLLARARRFGVVEPLRATLAYLTKVLGTTEIDEYTRLVADTRGNSRERLAFLLAGAPAGRLAGGTQLLAAHLRATANDPLSHVVRGLPRHLQEAWQTTSPAETLRVAFRKTVRLVRPPAQPARNRSASS